MGKKIIGPLARKDGLIIRNMHDEVLVYDTQRDHATALNFIAAGIWRACDGASDVPMIVARLSTSESPVDEDAVLKALSLLKKAHLLDVSCAMSAEMTDGHSRRQVVGSLGTAALMAVPVVIGITVPTPAQAASCLPGGASCTAGVQCCSGLCLSSACV